MVDKQKTIMERLRDRISQFPFSKGKDTKMNRQDISNVSSGPQTPINTVFYSTSTNFNDKPSCT